MAHRVLLSFVLIFGAACSSESGDADAQATVIDAARAPDAAVAHDDATTTANDDASVTHDDATTTANDDASVTHDDATTTANDDAAAPAQDAAAPDAAPEDAATPDAAMAGPLTITSPVITAGGTIPALHACGGRDLQPQLDFANIPPGTQSLAVVLIDDSIDYVHWIALDLPPMTSSLPQGASDDGLLPAPAREIPAYGTTYRGPCPPNRHTYTFRLYALSAAMTNYQWRGRNFTAATLQSAFGATTLGEARLTATFTP